MKTSTFLRRYMDSDHPFRQVGGKFHGLYSDDIEKFNELTQLIDYHCKFVNGLCKEWRKEQNPDPMCCCSCCREHFGYINFIAFHNLDNICNSFDNKHGFWTPLGCSLPRKWRSSTCLAHNCYNFISTPEKRLISIVREGLEAIDNYYVKYISADHEPGVYGSQIDKVYDHLKTSLLLGDCEWPVLDYVVIP
jgi:hypothetical protein